MGRSIPSSFHNVMAIHRRGAYKNISVRGYITMVKRWALGALLAALCVGFVGCAGAPSVAQPTKTPGRQSVFTVDRRNPLLSHGSAASWAARYIDPGAMVFHDGLFHMFFNGINSYPAPVSVGYATSPDGYAWTRVGDQPLLASQQVAYAGLTIFASSVLAQDDGTWALYFYTLPLGTSATDHGYIGRATAPRPTGPWTPDATPTLSPGAPGTWDSLNVAHPSVVRAGNGYVMYYSGAASATDPHGGIGRATSPDGVHWTKSTTPVLAAGAAGAWDAQFIFDPNVVPTPTGYAMVYLAVTPGGSAPTPYTAFGYATSPDGVTWTKSSVGPILSTLDHPEWQGIFLANLLYQNGALFLYFDAQPRANTFGVTDINLATHMGLLAA